MTDMNRKVALVTGAGTGIGGRVALQIKNTLLYLNQKATTNKPATGGYT
jgi:NAD(P)-dependent dehydrogenase (short-subunit alcohol dehydrogenase family)